jgi:hypothetical protein
MSDALERFATSLAQSKATLGPEECANIAQVILHGKPGSQSTEMVNEPKSQADISLAPDANQYFFQDEAPQTDTAPNEFSFQDDEPESASGAQPDRKVKPARKKKNRILGLTLPQLGILAGILLTWLCIMILFFVFFNTQMNV